MHEDGGYEDPKKIENEEGLATRWLKELELVKLSKSQQAFESIGERIVKKYRNATALEAYKSDRSLKGIVFNVLWSNTQVLKATCFSRLPNVVVERSYKDSDPVGRLAASICENCTGYMAEFQKDRFTYAVSSAVEDRLLPGRGQVWLRYEASFEEAKDETGAVITDEAGNPIRVPKPNSERVLVDPLNWQDFLTSASRNPFETRWVTRRLYMTKRKFTERFGKDKASRAECWVDVGESGKKKGDEDAEFLKQIIVYEIEDEESKTKIWISPGLKEEVCDAQKDPMGLSDFFSCPRIPLLATTTTDSMYPTPDYLIWEGLADELEYTTKRLSAMVECVRFVGATAAQYNKDVKNMLALSDGQLWPIANWAQFTDKSGFKGIIDWFPFEKALDAIPVLSTQQDKLLSIIFEITGVPDIVRGASDPNETLGAQKEKVRWVGIKSEVKQQDVQRFCREILSKMAEIIFQPGLFSDDTIALMDGLSQRPVDEQAIWQDALNLLRDDRLVTFRVDIETDSTIARDEESDKAARMEYIGALNQLMANVQQISQFRPELMKPVVESALFAIRAFRTGRSLEGVWEQAIKSMEENDAKAAEEAQANPPPPPPELMKLQVEQQAIQQKSEQGQAELELKHSVAKAELEVKHAELNIEMMKLKDKSQLDSMVHELEVFKEQFKQALDSKLAELEEAKTTLTQREKLIEEERLQKQQGIDTMKEMTARENAINDRLKIGVEAKKLSQPSPSEIGR